MRNYQARNILRAMKVGDLTARSLRTIATKCSIPLVSRRNNAICCYHSYMSSERAAYRRTHWRGGVAHSRAEAEEFDLEFWMSATPAERIRGVAQLVEEMGKVVDEHGSPARLQRTVGGVRPRRSR
ncbi:MAG: hypothetical protein NVS3B20_21000 [Polyangiales bacterium]